MGKDSKRDSERESRRKDKRRDDDDDSKDRHEKKSKSAKEKKHRDHSEERRHSKRNKSPKKEKESKSSKAKKHRSRHSSEEKSSKSSRSPSKSSERSKDDKPEAKKTKIGVSYHEEFESENAIMKELDDSSLLQNFEIDRKTIKALNKRGITHLFPIQSATYDILFEGSDLIGRDRTGSGKTLSYALPLVERMRKEGLFKYKSGQKPFILVVVPTRELAIQVTNDFISLKHEETGDFRVMAIYGGTEIRQQIQDVRAGVEVVVGTPGRLLDLLKREALSFSQIRAVVLDEADQMLNLGFEEDVEMLFNDYLYKHTEKEGIQAALFSATVPKWVLDISKKFLKPDYKSVDLIKGKEIKTPSTVKHFAINCPYYARNGAIADIVLCYGGSHSRTIIFCETKKEANDILLSANIKQECQVLHGDIPQKQREVTFKAFKEGKFKCLIATNVAARGLDIPHVDLIVQLEPPKDVDTYIHRAGRTARAGRSGVCVTFYNKKQQAYIDRIEAKANIKLQKIGAPQPGDIIKATARDIVQSLKNVSKEILPLFQDIASELIDEIGSVEALSRALALISGHTEKVKQRSLLCAMEGYVTYILETDTEFRAMSYIWSFLRRNFSPEITESIRGMRAFKTRKGAAFDVPEQYDQEFESIMDKTKGDRRYVLKKATELPEFEEEVQLHRTSHGGDRGRSSGGGDRDRGRSSTGGGDRGRSDRKDVRQRFGGKDDLKVFIGGLSYDADESDLRKLFEREGLYPTDLILLKGN